MTTLSEFIDDFESALKTLRARAGNRQYNVFQARLALALALFLDAASQAQIATHINAAREALQRGMNDAALKALWDEVSLQESKSGMTSASFVLRCLTSAHHSQSDEFRDGDEGQFVGWLTWGCKSCLDVSEADLRFILRDAGLNLAA